MLLKSKVSQIEMLSDEWRTERLTCFTSSKWYLLMGEKGLGDQGMTYIRTRVGEELTGMSSEVEFDNDAVRHGNLYEIEGVKSFAALKGIDFLITQKLIHEKGTRTASTPDFLWVRKESSDKLSYDVSNGEVKCFQMAMHIECAECATPAELKKVHKQVYWQVIHQMDECGCLTGYAIFYNPFFKIGGLRVIEFRKIDLVPEFTLLKQRKELALQKFDEIRNKLINIKN